MKLTGHNAENAPGRSMWALVFIGLALSFFFVAIATFAISSAKSGLSKDYLGDTSALKVLAHSIPKYASEAMRGNKDAFIKLTEERDNFERTWKTIQNGERDGFFVTIRHLKFAKAELDDLDVAWKSVLKSTSDIIDNEVAVIRLHNVSIGLNKIIPPLQREFDFILKKLNAKKNTSSAVISLHQQLLLTERLKGHLNKILEQSDDLEKTAYDYAKDVRTINEILDSMTRGSLKNSVEALRSNDIQKALRNIKDRFSLILDSVSVVENHYPDFRVVRNGQERINAVSPDLYGHVDSLSKKLHEINLKGLTVFGTISAAIAVLSFGGVLIDSYRQARVRYENEERVRREEEQRNQKNQEAILRLLDELGDLADGDLTIQTTVTEDFTGAIADSINFTIDQLRSLVSTINETAVKVSSAAQETQATAMQLAEASEHQAQEIAGASTAINQMAVSIDQVSANAAESAGVAERSVTIANKGSEVVHNTIRGMDTIREQIQETAKRIKRLGESSQEIGDIISLITDIADQTNILALNAAIQASMAGDAGRGFAVVADEVQRLAERASAATKQIEALVKTIQTDTNEAVISMEHTTAEVVRGARLAQNAGVALEEIENVSRSLADLIQNISNAARQQAASAGHVSNTMNVIQEITSQTSSGTNTTASSIGNLAELAVQMRNSVAGFKLPDRR